jgi:hypothetical protein
MLGGRVAPGSAASSLPEREAERSTGIAPEDDPWATQPDAPTTAAESPQQQPAEQAAAPTPEDMPDAKPPTANTALLKAVHTALTKTGIKSGAAHLAVICELTGRELASSAELTVEEARHVLAELAKPKPPEGWTDEQRDQLVADLLAACLAAPSEKALVAIGQQIADAVRAGKITTEDRETLSAGYKDAQTRGGRAAQKQPVPA